MLYDRMDTNGADDGESSSTRDWNGKQRFTF
jgi:hypothetical protein